MALAIVGAVTVVYSSKSSNPRVRLSPSKPSSLFPPTVLARLQTCAGSDRRQYTNASSILIPSSTPSARSRSSFTLPSMSHSSSCSSFLPVRRDGKTDTSESTSEFVLSLAATLFYRQKLCQACYRACSWMRSGGGSLGVWSWSWWLPASCRSNI